MKTKDKLPVYLSSVRSLFTEFKPECDNTTTTLTPMTPHPPTPLVFLSIGMTSSPWIWNGVFGGWGEGRPGLLWSQTDMFRFEMSWVGSFSEEQEGGWDKERRVHSSTGPNLFIPVLSAIFAPLLMNKTNRQEETFFTRISCCCPSIFNIFWFSSHSFSPRLLPPPRPPINTPQPPDAASDTPFLHALQTLQTVAAMHSAPGCFLAACLLHGSEYKSRKTQYKHQLLFSH